MEREYSNVGAAPSTRPASSRRSHSPVQRLGMARFIDPEAVTNETLDVALELLYESMGVNTDPQ